MIQKYFFKAAQICTLLIGLLGTFNPTQALAWNDTLVSTDFNVKQVPDTLSLAEIEFVAQNDSLFLKTGDEGVYSIRVDGEKFYMKAHNNRALFPKAMTREGNLFLIQHDQGYALFHLSDLGAGEFRIRHIPFFLSIIPPLVAIFFALLLKEVLVSLFLGVWAGVLILGGLKFDSLYQILFSIWSVIQVHVVEALTDSGHISIIVFSMLIGGMVALISKNGGMAGIVQKLAKYAKDRKSSQMVTWLLGIVVFFDDYANTLVVGNTMRPITDMYKVSREKLSYLVDSTAAPVAATAFITTWIGAQLAYIQSGISGLELGDNVSPYSIFFSSLQFAYYPFLTVIFMVLIILTGKEFGPMVMAEKRAVQGQVMSGQQKHADEPNMEDLSPVPGAKLHWLKAAIPVATVVVVTIFALVETGFHNLFQELNPSGGVYSWKTIWQQLNLVYPEGNPGLFVKLGRVIGSADSYMALIWASVSGLFVALILTLADKSLTLFNAMHWVTVGFKTMLPALLILVLAWSLASVSNQLHTAEFISLALVGNISPVFMPPLIFLLSFLIAFSTGSSWSTMAIFYPIAIPATYMVCVGEGMALSDINVYVIHVVSVVLAAAVFGDHCSPISDTTILSSLASDCNHLDHVKTQMPYAMAVGATSLLLSFLASWANLGVWFNLLLIPVGALLLFGLIHKIGTKVTET